MKKENFFKANINEAELHKFLQNELDEEERERFLEALDDENFSLLDGEIRKGAWYDTSDEYFFCSIIRDYDTSETLFKDQKAYEMIDNFKYNFNKSIYEDSSSENTQEYIFQAKKEVWDNYAKFLKDLALDLARWYRFDEFKTQEQNAILEKISEICDECKDEFGDDDKLNYDATAFTLSKGRTKVKNDERVEIIELIKRAKDALSELKKFIKKNILSGVKGHLSKETPVSEIEKFLKENSHSEVNDLLDSHSEVSDLLKKAEKLLKENEENKIFNSNNDVNFEYLYDNDLFYRTPGERDIEL